MNEIAMTHAARGVDHVAFPTFDPVATVRFYRDTLGFPVVHAVCAAGWGPEDHPDFVHFFFDIGNGDRLAFFYYFGLEMPMAGAKGDVHARFSDETPNYFMRSRHLAIHVDSHEELMEYRRRLDASEWPVELQVQHETIESIYTTDPNGYMFELTRALRPVLGQEDIDANISVDALLDIMANPHPTMDDLLVRKAELIVERVATQTEIEPPAALASVMGR
ncbi:VOC family protein [Mycobacterium vicinigordonae]|uniref:VOC family protein n=1 Tax=Mycobacterium vicinigordonae TaxID=1719132 RepID=A0A7D6HTC3_9MYCO|nr:VOC family protein [Mycobacterium vicinigordonae]QLL06153.1 VOC family protein [Mycobacterium vicinigordonae]